MPAKIRATCKTMTDGETKGRSERFGDTMGEASVETSRHIPADPEAGKLARFISLTHAKMRIHEDGSGMFTLQRDGKEFTLRWTEETEIPHNIELYANFDGTEGLLVTDEVITEEYKRGFREGSLAVAQAVRDEGAL